MTWSRGRCSASSVPSTTGARPRWSAWIWRTRDSVGARAGPVGQLRVEIDLLSGAGARFDA